MNDQPPEVRGFTIPLAHEVREAQLRERRRALLEHQREMRHEQRRLYLGCLVGVGFTSLIAATVSTVLGSDISLIFVLLTLVCWLSAMALSWAGIQDS